MKQFAFTAIIAGCLSVTTMAQSADLTARYFEALRMDEVFDILRQEGMEAGVELAENDDALSASPAWTARLERIYAPELMENAFRDGMNSIDEREGSEAAVAFFESELGQRIIDIELEARRALGDDEVEEATRVRVEEMRSEEPDRIEMYNEFITVNDLIDGNVSGALNSNLAFYRGLATSELYKDTMTENFILTSVWEQEAEIRKDMEDWTVNFSALAYSGLDNEDLRSYIDLSASDAGQKLNAVLFAGFDKVFQRQSYELGRAMADFMVGEDT